MRVVCIDDNYPKVAKNISVPLCVWARHPEKGEIYKVDEIVTYPDGTIGYLLSGFEGRIYGAKYFRPTDDTFGEWVESTLLENVVYEQTINQ